MRGCPDDSCLKRFDDLKEELNKTTKALFSQRRYIIKLTNVLREHFILLPEPDREEVSND